MLQISLDELYDILYLHYGETGWWPAETPDEVIMGAVLTQNTSWKNVEISLRKMRDNGIISLGDLTECDPVKLGDIIRSSGFFRQKSSRLIDIATAILKTYGQIDTMINRKTEELQIFLSSLKGVGQETMDCILLYVLEKPEFVVDKYTLRIFERIGIKGRSSIKSAKQIVQNGLGGNVEKMKNLHGMLVELAKDFCKVKPNCTDCPAKRVCDYATAEIK